ncbi:MAG: serine/threonine protein kinase [bacterium]|nr:serine/threonine protein kinase [bacterium]
MTMKFGKYEVENELGKGGMGVVYLAFDPVLERHVALKTIISSRSNTDLKERFIREARSAGKLRHNNIVTIYDFGEHGDDLYIAMELLEGRDLDQLIKEKPPMELTDKLEIIRQMCLGLHYAHQNDIFHRDVKPANIKILNDGHVKIMDFGLAIMQTSDLTKSDTVIGSPHYLSPERLKGLNSGGRSDQFAVGLILYELLTYRRSFDGDSISTILFKILNTEPPALDERIIGQLPEIESIIKKSIMKNPDHRYDTLKEMADDIESLQKKMAHGNFHMTEALTVSNIPMQTTVSIPKFAGGKMFYAAAATVVVIIAAALLYFFMIGEAPPKLRKAPGFLAFDVKPYARIDTIENIYTQEIVPMEAGQKTTPLRLAIEPGTYKVTYSHPKWGGVKRTKMITLKSGETVRQTDSLDDTFVDDAIKHFTVSR